MSTRKYNNKMLQKPMPVLSFMQELGQNKRSFLASMLIGLLKPFLEFIFSKRCQHTISLKTRILEASSVLGTIKKTLEN